MDLEISEIILKGLKRSSWAETRRHIRLGSLMKVHMIFIFQKVSWASYLTLSRDHFVLTSTEQRATLKVCFPCQIMTSMAVLHSIF